MCVVFGPKALVLGSQGVCPPSSHRQGVARCQRISFELNAEQGEMKIAVIKCSAIS